MAKDACNQDSNEVRYTIKVHRGPLPIMSELKRRFSYGVSELYGRKQKDQWVEADTRSGPNAMTDDEVVMVVKKFDPDIEPEVFRLGEVIDIRRVIAWGLAHGMVGATEKEAFAFACNPETADLQRVSEIVAIGATMPGLPAVVPALAGNADGRSFTHVIIMRDEYAAAHEMTSETVFLFVVWPRRIRVTKGFRQLALSSNPS